MVRLLGKSMQNIFETSLKSAYPTPWVKSTVAWHCRLISSKMKWPFSEECPCYTLTIPMSGFLMLSDLKPCIYKSSQLHLGKDLPALGSVTQTRAMCQSKTQFELAALITGSL